MKITNELERISTTKLIRGYAKENNLIDNKKKKNDY